MVLGRRLVPQPSHVCSSFELLYIRDTAPWGAPLELRFCTVDLCCPALPPPARTQTWTTIHPFTYSRTVQYLYIFVFRGKHLASTQHDALSSSRVAPPQSTPRACLLQDQRRPCASRVCRVTDRVHPCLPPVGVFEPTPSPRFFQKRPSNAETC